jgi:hypothetical protein
MAKFFHLQKNRKFSYKPRYYDERKEKREEREKAILKDLEDKEMGKPRLTKEDMANYIKLTRRTQKKSNVMLFVIFAILTAIFYMFFIK